MKTKITINFKNYNEIFPKYLKKLVYYALNEIGKNLQQSFISINYKLHERLKNWNKRN